MKRKEVGGIQNKYLPVLSLIVLPWMEIPIVMPGSTGMVVIVTGTLRDPVDPFSSQSTTEIL